jgi:hypothetical protein
MNISFSKITTSLFRIGLFDSGNAHIGFSGKFNNIATVSVADVELK